MIEYIDRQKAIEAALSCTDSWEPSIVDVTVQAIISKLKNIPSEDVIPVDKDTAKGYE